MDLYILDENLRRDQVIDDYESLIWTERYSETGDFELVIANTREVRNLLPNGTMLGISQSHRVMIVETKTANTNEDGEAILTVEGRSIEAILKDRLALPDPPPPPEPPAEGEEPVEEEIPPWEKTGKPAEIIRSIFIESCVTKPPSPEDTIPFYTPGGILPPGSIPEPDETVTLILEPGEVYELVKKFCDLYHLGFRLYKGLDDSKVYFEVYTGSDRTSLQSINDPVIFSPELDNLTDTTELMSTADLKNVAYVRHPEANITVTSEEVDNPTGFERRVLYVDAKDINLPPGPELIAALEQKGKEELANHRVVIAFDGEIPQDGSYLYGRDYNLGDLVEQRNADGLATNMRVTEQIFVRDEEGLRSYPTLTMDLLITPGSWYAWNSAEVWDEAVGVWADA